MTPQEAKEAYNQKLLEQTANCIKNMLREITDLLKIYPDGINISKPWQHSTGWYNEARYPYLYNYWHVLEARKGVVTTLIEEGWYAEWDKRLIVSALPIKRKWFPFHNPNPQLHCKCVTDQA